MCTFTLNLIPSVFILLMVRGCTGNIIGKSSDILLTAIIIPSNVFLSSTLEGRCSVNTAYFPNFSFKEVDGNL